MLKLSLWQPKDLSHLTPKIPHPNSELPMCRHTQWQLMRLSMSFVIIIVVVFHDIACHVNATVLWHYLALVGFSKYLFIGSSFWGLTHTHRHIYIYIWKCFRVNFSIFRVLVFALFFALLLIIVAQFGMTTAFVYHLATRASAARIRPPAGLLEFAYFHFAHTLFFTLRHLCMFICVCVAIFLISLLAALDPHLFHICWVYNVDWRSSY